MAHRAHCCACYSIFLTDRARIFRTRSRDASLDLHVDSVGLMRYMVMPLGNDDRSFGIIMDFRYNKIAALRDSTFVRENCTVTQILLE